MSFSLGEKDKTDQPSTSADTRKNPLESITDPERQDELERGGMIMGPNHPGFRSEQQQQQGCMYLRISEDAIGVFVFRGRVAR